MRGLKIILSTILFSLALSLNAQWVDSASVSYRQDTLSVYIEGDVFIYDFDAIKRITPTITTDTVFADVIFLPCSPFQQLAPYDTAFEITGTFSAGLNYLRLYTILYEDTIGSCYSSNGNQVVDTVTLAFNVPLSTKEFEKSSLIRVFPNPATDFIFYRTPMPVDRVEIINSSGIKVKSITSATNPVDMLELPPGIYFLKFEIDGQVETVKMVKQ